MPHMKQQLVEQLIQKTHERKKLEFFAATPSVPPKRNELSDSTRQENWRALFNNFGKEGHDFWFEQDPEEANAVIIGFANGLIIKDYDKQGVAFWARESKDEVDPAAAQQTVGLAAHHLFQRGDRLEVSGHGIYGGSKPYIDAFEKATANARDLFNKDLLKKLAHEK